MVIYKHAGSASAERVRQGEVGETGGGGWGHPQGAVHMVAAGLALKRPWLGTQRATPCPDHMDRLRKHYSHLVGGWFLARKAA